MLYWLVILSSLTSLHSYDGLNFANTIFGRASLVKCADARSVFEAKIYPQPYPGMGSNFHFSTRSFHAGLNPIEFNYGSLKQLSSAYMTGQYLRPVCRIAGVMACSSVGEAVRDCCFFFWQFKVSRDLVCG
jgi:hypothetical protein